MGFGSPNRSVDLVTLPNVEKMKNLKNADQKS